MDLGAAVLAVVTGVIVKGVVMVLGAWLVVKVYGAAYAEAPRRLWLVVPEASRGPLRILWWALLLFAVSELTCGIELYVLFHSSPILSGIHAFASASGMALYALGLLRFADGRMLRFGAPACLGHRVCPTCTVAEPAGCRFRPSLQLAATLLALAAIPPMLASTARMTADVTRYMLPFPAVSAWWDRTVVPFLVLHMPNYQPTGEAYYLPHSMLVIELRVLPLLAAAAAVVAIGALQRRRLAGGADLLALAAGIMAYAYFELVLYRGTGDVLLGSLGHEVAEFWFLAFTVELLRQLLGRPAGAAATS